MCAHCLLQHSCAFDSLLTPSSAISSIASATAHSDAPAAASAQQLQATNADVAAARREIKSLADSVLKVSKEQVELREEVAAESGDEQRQRLLLLMREHVDARVKESEGKISCCASVD